MSMSTTSSFLDEIRQVEEILGSENVERRGDEAVDATLSATPYRQVRVRAVCPTGYPDVQLAVELDSPILPPGVVKKLQRQCQSVLGDHKGRAQLVPMIESLADIVLRNKLLYALRDVRRTISLVGDTGVVKANEEAGTVRVRATHGRFFVAFQLTVPELYPAQPLGVDILKSNFHEKLVRTFGVHCQDIVRRCAAGVRGERAIASCTRTKDGGGAATVAAGGGGAAAPPEYRLTSQHMLNLKHDVRYLKQAAELRKVNAERKDGDHRQFAHSTAERRAARRTLKRLAKDEERSEEQQLEHQRLLAEAEEGVRRRVDGGDDGGGPADSLFAVASYLVDEFCHRIPEERCQACRQRLFPEEPAEALKVVRTSRDSVRPVRVYCSHWFHHRCLDAFITSPPFNKPCPHSDWPADVKKLEKRWATQQAKKREIDEIGDLLGL